MKLHELTYEHQMILAGIRQQALQRATRCEPADRTRAEAAIAAVYRHCHLPRPAFAWCQSPWAALQILNDLPNRCCWLTITECILIPLISLMIQAINARYEPSFLHQIQDHFDFLECMVEQSTLGGVIDDDIQETYQTRFAPASHGDQSDAKLFVHFITYQTFGLTFDPITEELFRLCDEPSKHCWCFFPHEEVCLICERPAILLLDDNAQLHSETGWALQFRDGYGLRAIHGQRMEI